MSSREEYKKFVDECMGWAKTARTDRERQIFLQMARACTQSAILTDEDLCQKKSPDTSQDQDRATRPRN